MDEREQKAEIFRAQYLEYYKGEANIEAHPTIAVVMQFHNKKFSDLRIRNVCNLGGVIIY